MKNDSCFAGELDKIIIILQYLPLICTEVAEVKKKKDFPKNTRGPNYIGFEFVVLMFFMVGRREAIQVVLNL